jgi:hypothetical protein
MKDHQVVDLEEYKQLRAEILTRLTLHNQLTSYTVATMTAGLAIFSNYPDVLLAISFLTSWFWLLYASHDGHIFRIAQYIALELAPRLAADGHAALGWEAYLRKFDAREVDVPGQAAKMKASKTGISTSMAVIFGGSAPVLIIIFWVSQWPIQKPGIPLYGRILATACAIVMWVNAMRRARDTTLLRKNVNSAIVATASARHRSHQGLPQ